MINESIRKKIVAEIQQLESKHDIQVIHAVESGSRAWGFPSQDSDYDVRIIYKRPLKYYISIFDKPDHIDVPIDSELDIGGWDVSKCLKLLQKGNAVIHEWLNSPIVYASSTAEYTRLKNTAATVFNPTPAFHHYLSMARNRFLSHTPPKTAKSFLYGLRALLCAQWIHEFRTSPPVVITGLFERYLDAGMREAISALMDAKLRGSESDEVENITAAFSSCKEGIAELENITVTPSASDSSVYDSCLHEILRVV